ncbi:copper chaperone CopZ [Brachybacterium muris]|nr:copper chaperone CopZ [Brachybacterium muris]
MTTAITVLEGVEEVRIDLAPGGISTVTVAGAAAPAAVRAAVAEAGYTVADA